MSIRQPRGGRSRFCDCEAVKNVDGARSIDLRIRKVSEEKSRLKNTGSWAGRRPAPGSPPAPIMDNRRRWSLGRDCFAAGVGSDGMILFFFFFFFLKLAMPSVRSSVRGKRLAA